MADFDLTVQVKLGSIIEHLIEYTGHNGHPFDLETARVLYRDDAVQAWLTSLRDQQLLPVRRHG